MPTVLSRIKFSSGWVLEVSAAVIGLGLGFGLMPLLIFYAGASSLGRYEGASAAAIYDTVYGGLAGGSSASWIVVLGPYVLYLLFKALRLWWRGSAKLA